MRILFTTDLHGSWRKYDQLLDAARRSNVEMVVNGGDMLPKQGNLFSQGDFISGYLSSHFAQFEEAGIYYLCYLGNDDLLIFDELFESVCRPYRHVISFAQRKVDIGGYEFIGMNWVTDYPFRLKDRSRMDASDYTFQEQYGTGLLSTPQGWQEIPDWFSYARSLPTIEDELDRLPRPDNPANTVYVIHMPLSDLGLDQCGHGPQVGSKAVYRFLERLQPRLALHGHIHESPETSGKWFGHIGQTLCIQPGQLDPFTYVVIDLETMEFERKTELGIQTVGENEAIYIRGKKDLENANRLVAMGYPAVAPLLPHLIEWIQDGNWPVAHIIAPFLASIGEPVIPEIRRVLTSQDDTWKYFCITGVVAIMDRRVLLQLQDDLQRIARNPTPGERVEEVDQVAKEVLAKLEK